MPVSMPHGAWDSGVQTLGEALRLCPGHLASLGAGTPWPPRLLEDEQDERRWAETTCPAPQKETLHLAKARGAMVHGWQWGPQRRPERQAGLVSIAGLGRRQAAAGMPGRRRV